MARIAHLILTHRSPKQTLRLLEALAHPNHDCYVHVDKKVKAGLFDPLFSNTPAKKIRQRKPIHWGTYSMVDATLTAFSEILQSGSYDFINLLSESDYPLVSNDVIDAFLTDHLTNSFMDYHREGSDWWETAKPRFTSYHLDAYPFKGKYLLQRILSWLPLKRKMPYQFELVGHSQWFTMNTKHAAYVMEFVESHPDFVRFFKHTWGADEFFFQTILFNSPFRSEVVNDNLRYIDWNDGAASPRVLTSDDYVQLTNAKKLYARKFDVDVDPSILDILDSHRTKKR